MARSPRRSLLSARGLDPSPDHIRVRDGLGWRLVPSGTAPALPHLDARWRDRVHRGRVGRDVPARQQRSVDPYELASPADPQAWLPSHFRILVAAARIRARRIYYLRTDWRARWYGNPVPACRA